MTIEVQPPKKASPWRWVLLIGCGVLILGMGACAGLMALGWGFVKNTVILDPAKVNAMAAEILPGSAAPPGFQPQMGMDVAGFRMAMFGPKDGPDDSTIGVMLFPMKPEEFGWQQAVEHMEKQSGSDRTEKVISTTATTLPLGGQDAPGIEQVVEEGGVRKIRRIAMLATPTKDKVVMLLLEGPEGGARDEAFAAFGNGVRLDGYTILGGDPQAGAGPAEPEASPAEPAASPEAEAPPEETTDQGPAEEEPTPTQE